VRPRRIKLGVMDDRIYEIASGGKGITGWRAAAFTDLFPDHTGFVGRYEKRVLTLKQAGYLTAEGRILEREKGLEPSTSTVAKRPPPRSSRYRPLREARKPYFGVTWTSSPLRRGGVKSGVKLPTVRCGRLEFSSSVTVGSKPIQGSVSNRKPPARSR
jgi:hypothetical protein